MVALILSTAVTLGLKALFGFENIHSALAVDIRAVTILTILACVGAVYKKMRSKQASPILMIVIAAVLGAVMYA